MSLTNNAMIGGGSSTEGQAGADLNSETNFRFVPRELAVRCRKLVESYHAIYGYACLPDMLWNSDARDVIECQRDLTRILTKASKSRCAKRANDSFVLIATVIVALEVLARDFAGWGKRFPAAKREAEGMLIDFPLRPRTWFMDKYLYPSLGIHREFASALAPSASMQAMARN
jgi:hypothetical protein